MSQIMRVLTVGAACARASAARDALGVRAWSAYPADTVREAGEILGTFQFDAVLAEENLPDGTGYDLAEAVTRRGISLFVGVALSESWLWLPVVERGVPILGKRALDQERLGAELEAIFTFGARGVSAAPEHGGVRTGAKKEMPPWRKSVSEITMPGRQHLAGAPLLGAPARRPRKAAS
jgi:hypothetical protein